MEILRFVGVSTGGSSISRVFPIWARELGLDAAIEGVDLPLDVGSEGCRETVVKIVGHPDVRGAVVTTHKTKLFEHTADLFADLDPYARLCREISCIAVRDGQAHGWAKDPVTARRVVEDMLGPGAMPDAAVCFGAGGAGLAISVALLGTSPGPSRLTLIDTVPSRLDLARSVHEGLGTVSRLDCRSTSEPWEADDLLRRLPPGSLVINATGMGKDLPGSPLSGGARFPSHGIVWDLNYRGELSFLQLARSQQEGSDLRVFDGWRYFLHGWAEATAEVFALSITPNRFERLASLAEPKEP